MRFRTRLEETEIIIPHDEEIKYYGYRSAFLKDTFVEIELKEDSDKGYDFVKKICDEIGKPMDNHIVFEIGSMAIAYSDHVLYIGSGVIERAH